MTKKTGVSNRRLMIAKNSIMMLVVLVVIFLAVFAWYFVNKEVSATGITVNAALPDEVEIAPEEVVNVNNTEIRKIGTWSQTATFNGPFRFSSDVTSDGLNFIVPGFSSTEDNDQAKADARYHGKIVNVNGIPSVAKNNLTITQADLDEGRTAEYYSIPFYLRSRNPDIFVKSSAYLAMAAEKTLGDVKTGSDSVRKSAYGNFTADTLVAAMRVSITGAPVESISSNVATVNADNECNFVWVPRPDLFLTIPAGASEDDWTLVSNVTKTKNDLERLGESVAAGTTFKHNYYTPRLDGNDNPIGVKLVEDTSADNSATAYKSDTAKTKTLVNGSVPTLGTGKNITDGFTTSEDPINMTVTGSQDTADYYVYKLYLNLWIEGTDTEARRAMDTGEFSLYIEFGNSDR